MSEHIHNLTTNDFTNQISDQSDLEFVNSLTARQKWLFNNRVPQLLTSLLSRENGVLSSKQAFELFSAADPSQNNSATQWLMETYIKGGFWAEDIAGGKNSKAFDILKDFSKYKSRLNTDQKNLYTYNMLADVYGAIENFVLSAQAKEDEILSQDLVGRELKRQEKLNAASNTHILLDDIDLKIVIPLTQQASQWWGRGTKWCTAARENNYFESYNRKAPLFVCLAKTNQINNGEQTDQNVQDYSESNSVGTNKDPFVKYQIWIPNPKLDDKSSVGGKNGSNNIQFTDQKDRPLSVEFVQINWHIFEPVIRYGLTVNGEAIKYVPEHILDRDLCLNAALNNCNAIEYVPAHIYDENLALKFAQIDGICLKNIPKEYRTRQVCLAAINNNFQPELVKQIPDNIWDHDFSLEVVKIDPEIFNFIPDNLKDKEVCWAAINNEKVKQLSDHSKRQFFKSINPEFFTKDWASTLVKNSGFFLEQIVENYPNFVDQNMCEQAVQSYSCALTHVPEKFLNKNIINLALTEKSDQKKDFYEQTYLALKYIPEHLVDTEVCDKAVQINGLNLQFVHEKFLTKELAVQACEQNGFTLSHVPDNFKDIQLYTVAVEQNCEVLQWVPEEYKTEKLCWNIIKQGRTSVYSVPAHLKDKISQAINLTENQAPLWDLTIVDQSFKQTIDQLSEVNDCIRDNTFMV